MNDRASQSGQGKPHGSTGEEARAGLAVRAMFAAVAPRYDLLNHLLSCGFDVAWRRRTARALRGVLEKPASCVADLCCGTGDLSLGLARLSRGRVLAADFCPPMLTLARRKAAAYELRVQFLAADTLCLPFSSNSLDALTLAFGFRNLSNYGRGLEEMRRVLKTGGWLAILEFSQLRWPVFGSLFRFYFRRLLPLIGTWISGLSGPYRYLPDSVSRFPDQEALAEILRAEGFRKVRYRNFTGGIAALHLGEK